MNILHMDNINKSFNLFNEKKHYILFLILAAALTLRIWGMWHGFPYLYKVDEGHEVLRAMRLGTGSFDFNRIVKGGYFYLLFVEYAIYFLILKIVGTVQSATEFAQMFIREPWSFYLIGRITTALIGTLNVFIVYLIGKEIYSKKAGLIAALFLAVNFLHASNSQNITVDVPMACLATIALLYAIRIVQSGENSCYIKAAFFSGLAVITKMPAIMLLVPLAVAHYFNISKEDHKLKEFFFGKKTVTALLIFMAVVCLGNPGLLLKFSKVVHNVLYRFFSDAPSSLTNPRTQYLIDPPNLFLYYFTALKTAMGLPLFLFSLAATVYGMYRRNKEDIVLIAFMLIYYIVFSLSRDPHQYYPRYMLPILPVLALLSSSLLSRMTSKFSFNLQTAILLISVCVLVIEPGYRIILRDYRYSHKDTRTFAKEWIENNIPANSKVLIEGSRTKPINTTVPLQNSRENILKSIENYKDEEPGKEKYYEFKLGVLSGVTYDLIMIGPPIGEPDFRLKPLSHYKKIGVEYMVLRPDLYIHHRKLKKLKSFVQSLKSDPEVKLLKRFEPDRLTRPGPAIEIYQIKSEKYLKTPNKVY